MANKPVECYVCDEQITKENQTYEHIVLNAIGGKLASTQLFCDCCNDMITSKMDAELAAQFNLLTNFLMVHRHRGGTPPPVKGKVKSGEKYEILNGSKPVMSDPDFEKKNENGGIRYSASASSDKQMKTILKGIKRNHPQFNDKEAFEKATRRQFYMGEPIKFDTTVGGDLALKSVSKSAMNFFIYSGGDKQHIKHLIPHLTNQEELGIVAHYIQEALPYEHEPSEVNHVLHLVGDPKEKILYCYVEYFSAYSFIVKLNDDYDGNPIKCTYCYDVAANTKLDKEVEFILTKKEYDRINGILPEYRQYLVQRLKRVLNVAEQKQVVVENNRIINESMDTVQKRYPEIDGITKEMLSEFLEEVAIRAACFIDHLSNKGK